MIKFLRQRRVQKILLIIISTLIVLSFVLWGIPFFESSDKKHSLEAGWIDSRPVSTGEFIKEYRALRNILFLNWGSLSAQFFKNMDFEAMTWERILLADDARRLKIKASNKEVVEWITAHPAFSNKETFREDVYQFFVRNKLKMSPRQFEEDVRGFLTADKVRQARASSQPVSETQIREVYERRYAPRDLKYAVLPYQSLPVPEVTGEEINSYFEMMKPSQNGRPLTLEEATPGITERLLKMKHHRVAMDKAREFRATVDAQSFETQASTAGWTVLSAAGYKSGDSLEGAGSLGGAEADVTSLEIGKLSEPLPAEKGVVLVLVTAFEPAPLDQMPAELEEKIRKELEDESRNEDFADYLKDLRTKLKVNSQTMRLLFPDKYAAEPKPMVFDEATSSDSEGPSTPS